MFKKMREMAVRDAENVVYDMVINADKKDELVSHKNIEEKLKVPPYKLSTGAISGVIKKMRLKHMIKLKKIKKQHYYELPWLTTPYWLAFIFSGIITFCAILFLISYNWYETIEAYYFGIDNGVFVNHHYLTIAFIIVVVVNNIIFAVCWHKFGTRKLIKKSKKLKKVDRENMILLFTI